MRKFMRRFKNKKRNKTWFTSEYFLKKGSPKEQIEFEVNGHQITVYNFNSDKPFSDKYVEEAKEALAELASKFPQIVGKLRWILIDDNQPPSVYGDPDKYPFNGQANDDWKTLILYPRAMEFSPHRVAKVSNFTGTMIHELAHLNQSDFIKEWGEKYRWAYLNEDDRYKDQWEWRLTPDGRTKRLFNKNTAEMSPWGEMPLESEECVTSYARININEDICESMVAYVCDPRLLERVSPAKFDILTRHDARGLKPAVSAIRIAQEEIKMPEVKPETVRYYVVEVIS